MYISVNVCAAKHLAGPLILCFLFRSKCSVLKPLKMISTTYTNTETHYYCTDKVIQNLLYVLWNC